MAEREASIWIRLKGAGPLKGGLRGVGRSFEDIGKRGVRSMAKIAQSTRSLGIPNLKNGLTDLGSGFKVVGNLGVRSMALLGRGITSLGRRIPGMARRIGGLGRSFVGIGKRGVSSIARIGSSILSLKTLIMGGLVYGALRMLHRTIGDLTGAYAIQQDAIAKLNVNLQSQGNFTEMVTRRLQEQAAALQKVTTYGDEQIIQGQAVLASYGATGEQIERMTPIILNFAAATGQDLKSAFDLAGKASVGYTGTLSRYGIIIDQSIPKAKQFEAAMVAMAERGGAAAEAMAKTARGRFQQMSNLWGDLKERIGEFIATSPGAERILADINVQIERAIGWLNDNEEAISNLVSRGYEALIRAGKSVKQTFVDIANDPATYEWLARIETGIKAIFYGTEMAIRSIERLVRRSDSNKAFERAQLQDMTVEQIVDIDFQLQDPEFLKGSKDETKEIVRKQLLQRRRQLKANLRKMEMEDQRDYGMSAREYAKKGEESDDVFMKRMGTAWDDLTKTADKVNTPETTRDKVTSALGINPKDNLAEVNQQIEQNQAERRDLYEQSSRAPVNVDMNITIEGAGVGVNEILEMVQQKASTLKDELQRQIKQKDEEYERLVNRQQALAAATS